MIIEQLIKEKRKIKYRYLSEHSQKGKIAARYIDYSPLKKFKKAQMVQPQSINCTVQLTGSSCQLDVGKIDIEMKNEPTEPLKNIKKALHPRFVPNAPLLSHDPKYGGWIDPFEFRSKPKKREKKYEYY